MKKGGFWYRWLYVRRCECCGWHIDVRKDEHYVRAFSHPVLCKPCFQHCMVIDRRWKHMVVRL